MTHINEKKKDIKSFHWHEPPIRELSEASGSNPISLKIYIIEISRTLGIAPMAVSHNLSKNSIRLDLEGEVSASQLRCPHLPLLLPVPYFVMVSSPAYSQTTIGQLTSCLILVLRNPNQENLDLL